MRSHSHSLALCHCDLIAFNNITNDYENVLPEKGVYSFINCDLYATYVCTIRLPHCCHERETLLLGKWAFAKCFAWESKTKIELYNDNNNNDSDDNVNGYYLNKHGKVRELFMSSILKIASLLLTIKFMQMLNTFISIASCSNNRFYTIWNLFISLTYMKFTRTHRRTFSPFSAGILRINNIYGK